MYDVFPEDRKCNFINYNYKFQTYLYQQLVFVNYIQLLYYAIIIRMNLDTQFAYKYITIVNIHTPVTFSYLYKYFLHIKILVI